MSQRDNKSKRGVARTSSQLHCDAIIRALELPEKDPCLLTSIRVNRSRRPAEWQSNKSSWWWVIGYHGIQGLSDGNHLQSALTIRRCIQMTIIASPSKHIVSLYCYHLPTSTAQCPVGSEFKSSQINATNSSIYSPNAFFCCSTWLHTVIPFLWIAECW